MQLKTAIDSPCGLRFMLDKLELQSGFARRCLLDMEMLTQAADIQASYDVLHQFAHFVDATDRVHLSTLLFKLQALKDIRTTIQNLEHHATLDDIELFEVKHLAILAVDVKKLLAEHGMEQVVEIPDLDEVITILDPDGLKMASFYIYDSYCQQLKDLRSKMRQNPELNDQLLLEASDLELGVRIDLSKQLHHYATAIRQALLALANVDIYLAKALQMKQMGLCFPVISQDGSTRFEGLFHPQVKEALAAVGRQYQPVDISFDLKPTLITGANMGGKTVVLKTLTLCQYLFQFGFGIPATSAHLDVKSHIFFCIGDEQSVEKGLSSFAAEMKNIDAVIKASRNERKLLALIDEPARTTNPTEGAALVAALLKVLAAADMSLLLTTHYDIEPGDARCLRVKGFDNGVMNYSLVEVHDGEVPHEALNIAQALDIDPQWISLARDIINKNERIL